MTICQICDGAGVVEKDGKLYECSCAELRRIYASMPAYVRSAVVRLDHITASFPNEKIRIVNAVDRSIYITAYWADMRAIIKTIMVMHRDKFVRVISDREIRDVFVGSTSRVARGENSKEAVYNSIEDLVKSPHLLMIRLNELGYKNKAAAGILEEALCYRLDRNLPVWLLSNSTKPFGAGSYAYSENVWSLMMSLPRIRLAPIHSIDSSTSIIGNEEFASGETASIISSALAPEHAAPSVPRKTKPVMSVMEPKSLNKQSAHSGFTAVPFGLEIEEPKTKQIFSAPDNDEPNLGGLANLGKGLKRKFGKF